jgi:hypothetical protein
MFVTLPDIFPKYFSKFLLALLAKFEAKTGPEQQK